METPFFVPAARDLAAMAAYPSDGELREPAIVLFAGDDSRNRVGVLRDAARALADLGHPVMRFDYPGIGMSPTEKMDKRWDLLPIALEACVWFREQTGLSRLALGGTCLGARAVLAVGAREPSVASVVGMGCPIRPRKRVNPRVRAGIVAIDAIGPRVVSKFTRGARTRDRGVGWEKGLIEDITCAAEHAVVSFLYGGEDEYYGDFDALIASGDLPPGVAEVLRVRVLEGEQLRGLMSVEHHSWVREQFVDALASLESVT